MTLTIDANRQTLTSRKYQRPDFISSTVTQTNYEKWLHGRTVAHVKRDRKRGNKTTSN